jgi:hypothetical protein
MLATLFRPVNRPIAAAFQRSVPRPFRPSEASDTAQVAVAPAGCPL